MLWGMIGFAVGLMTFPTYCMLRRFVEDRAGQYIPITDERRQMWVKDGVL